MVVLLPCRIMVYSSLKARSWADSFLSVQIVFSISLAASLQSKAGPVDGA
jgi:hypothetical protein